MRSSRHAARAEGQGQGHDPPTKEGTMRTSLARSIRAAECALIDVPGAPRYPRYDDLIDVDRERYLAIARALLARHPHTEEG